MESADFSTLCPSFLFYSLFCNLLLSPHFLLFESFLLDEFLKLLVDNPGDIVLISGINPDMWGS